MKDIRSILTLTTEFFEKKGVPRARFEAECLLAHFLRCKRMDLYMEIDRPLLEEELAPFREGVKRRAIGEPYAHIVGEISFFDCALEVGPQALIPRQETEILMERVCQAGGTKALDLCTGSGCIAIALKKARPDMDVTGVDISKEALELARRNGVKNGVEVEWLEGDLLEPVRGKKFDLVVCNPPYVTEAEYAELEVSVRDFEPKLALVGGKTGLEVYERLKTDLPAVLNAGAKVFFEIGEGQGKALKEMFDTYNAELFQDWAGKDRFFRVEFS